MRTSVVHQNRRLGGSDKEQLVGVRLAAAHTRESSGGPARVRLAGRSFSDASELPKHIGVLVGSAGWDRLRLLAAALANGSALDEQVAYLGSAGPISGATGILRFDASDHDGHWRDNPTTIARLADGVFVPASKLAR